jgi:hypothetical protein
MMRISGCLAMLLCILPVGVANAQEKANELVLNELAELRAEFKALQAKIAKVEGDAGKPTISEHDKKWVRKLAGDFMNEMVKKQIVFENLEQKRFAPVRPFLSKEFPEFKHVEDPNVKVTHRFAKGIVYLGFRRAYLDYVFDKYQIDSEEVAPDRAEVLLQRKLVGNRTEFSVQEDYGKEVTAETTIEKGGKLGPRTGSFSLRISREKDTNRWLISYFAWTIDEIKKDLEKK